MLEALEYRQVQTCYNCAWVNDGGVDEIALDCEHPFVKKGTSVEVDHVCKLYVSIGDKYACKD